MGADHIISLLLAAAFLAVVIITVVHGSYIKRQNEEKKRQLLVALAHDIGTPLSVIRGYAEGIMDGVADSEDKRRAYLSQIYDKSLEMDQLLSDMMLYVRASSSEGLAYQMESFDPVDALEEFLNRHKREYELRKTKVTFQNLAEHGISIRGDKKQLARVLENLIENSIKYKKEGDTKVDLKLELMDDGVVLYVADEGKGIRSEELPFIFEDMYRGKEHRGSLRGSGVGLWLVKHIIADHGGRVWAKSEYGKGTVIGIYLDCNREPDTGSVK